MAWLRSSPRLALSSLKRRWRQLSFDISGDTNITGSNQFPNGSGL